MQRLCFIITLRLTRKMTSNMQSFNLFLSFVLTHATWINILRNTRSYEDNSQRNCMSPGANLSHTKMI